MFTGIIAYAGDIAFLVPTPQRPLRTKRCQMLFWGKMTFYTNTKLGT